MANKKHLRLSGKLRVGQGQDNQLTYAYVCCPYGDKTKLNIDIGSEERSITINLDRESALEFATKILQELGDNHVD